MALATLAAGADPRKILAGGTPEEIEENLGYIRRSLERDAFHWTPLMLAAAHNPDPAAVRILLDRGEQLNARSLDDWDALMFAAAFNPDPRVLEVLLDAGADPNRRTRDAWVAGYGFARFTGKMVLFDGLGAFDEPPPGEDRNYGWSALFFAARYNDSPGVLKALLDGGADPRLQDEHGRRALDFLDQDGEHPGKIRNLLEEGVPPQ